MKTLKTIYDFFRLWILWGDRKEAWQDAKLNNDPDFKRTMKEFDNEIKRNKMKGKLIKRNKKWLVEFTSNFGTPNLLPLHPDDELTLSLRSEFRFDDLDGLKEVEFGIVEYNKKGSAYNSYHYPQYAKLSPGASTTTMISDLKQHLASITPEIFQTNIDEIELEGFGDPDGVGNVTMDEFICSMPDCPHCAYEMQQQYEEDLEKEASIDFVKWLAKDWMSIWVENKWMWECQTDPSPYSEKYGYLTEEQLYELYLKELNESTCISCDEEKLTHNICMDCIGKMIEENQEAINFLKWTENKYSHGNVLGYWYKNSDSRQTYTAEYLYELYLKEKNESK